MRASVGGVLLGLALVAGGCATPGASEAPSTAPSGTGFAASQAVPSITPTSGTEATMRPTPSPSSPAAASAAPFTVSSTAFDDGAAIPRRFTCDGEDVSPDLAWSGAPGGTRSLALIVRDPDAGDFVHWLAFDIPGSPSGTLRAGASGSTAVTGEGTNGFGRRGWGGPCPPSGTHHYVFVLYALDRSLGLGGAPRIRDLEAAMQGHVLGQARRTGTYRRG